MSDVLKAARPLSEALWQGELGVRPIDTPERRADLERRLMAQAAVIADRSVQAEYRRFLRDRLFALQRPARPPTRRTAAAFLPGRPGGDPPPPLPGSTGRRNREVFLGILVQHPTLLDEWIEDIAALDIPEPPLDSLRRAILDAIHTRPGLDAATLRQHLASCGHTEILGALAKTIAGHAGFAARGGDDPDVIRLGLAETLQLVRPHGPGDREEAARALAQDASDENWRRLKALKEREAQDGPVGGFE